MISPFLTCSNISDLLLNISESSFNTSEMTKLFKGGFGQGPNLTSSNFGTKILPSLTDMIF